MILVVASLISGCAGTSSHVQDVAADEAPVAPAPGKAAVVFLRPSGFGSWLLSFVYEIKDNQSLLVGIVTMKTKVAYQVEPGKRLFMLDRMQFMTADLLPNRTYYVIVDRKTDALMRRSHFALEPVRGEELDSPEFRSMLADCKWIVKTDASTNWERGSVGQMDSRSIEFYANWLKRPEPERPHLLQVDGR